jgi:hypothetical protein
MLILNNNIMKKIFLLIAAGLILVNCTKPDVPVLSAPVVCDSTNTLFQQLYNPLNTTTYPEYLSKYPNVQTHEYTFNVTNAATICSVGYQSQSTTATSNYIIEIYDTVTSTVAATVTSTFSATTTSYASLSSPLALVAGRSYKIKRYSPATSASINGAGRCVSNSSTSFSTNGNVSFPKTFGNLTITDSDFYTAYLYGIVSANDNNNSLPYIDIVFQQ